MDFGMLVDYGRILWQICEVNAVFRENHPKSPTAIQKTTKNDRLEQPTSKNLQNTIFHPLDIGGVIGGPDLIDHRKIARYLFFFS